MPTGGLTEKHRQTRNYVEPNFAQYKFTKFYEIHLDVLKSNNKL